MPKCHPRPTPPPLETNTALFLDVDGTLLEIAARPELVRVPSGLPALLDRLRARSGGALAVVSGRRLADIDRLLRPWQGAAAGLHGAERRRADGTLAPTGDRDAEQAAAAALNALRPQLLAFAGAVSGVRLEDKGGTLALHYRAAPEREAEVRDFAKRLTQEHHDTLRLIAGKMVVELLPRLHNKGEAIAAYLNEAPFRGRLPVFLGDDTTDEDGFAAVNRHGGLSIRIGDPGKDAATAAAYRLPSVAAAHAWLAAGDRG